MDINFDKVRRVLIRGVNWVGDTILTLPAVQAIRDLFPQSNISVLSNEDVSDLWRRFPFIDEVITFKRKKGLEHIFEDLKIRNILIKKDFDLAFILPRSLHSAMQIFLAQIPIRIGYGGIGRSFILTHRLARSKDVLNIHRILYYKKLVEIFGKKVENHSPKIFLSNDDRAIAEKFMREFGISGDGLIIGMNPGATYGLAKCWPPNRFGELGKRLSHRWKVKFIIFGKSNEKQFAQEIMKMIGNNAIDLTGKTSLLQLAALLERCHLLISNDTGTMHLATAVGTPVIAIFGSTDPKTTGPWGNGNIIIKKDISCSPCLKRVCPYDHRCMELIEACEVEEAVNKKLMEVKVKGNE